MKLDQFCSQFKPQDSEAFDRGGRNMTIKWMPLDNPGYVTNTIEPDFFGFYTTCGPMYQLVSTFIQHYGYESVYVPQFTQGEPEFRQHLNNNETDLFVYPATQEETWSDLISPSTYLGYGGVGSVCARRVPTARLFTSLKIFEPDFWMAFFPFAFVVPLIRTIMSGIRFGMSIHEREHPLIWKTYCYSLFEHLRPLFGQSMPVGRRDPERMIDGAWLIFALVFLSCNSSQTRKFLSMANHPLTVEEFDDMAYKWPFNEWKIVYYDDGPDGKYLQNTHNSPAVDAIRRSGREEPFTLKDYQDQGHFGIAEHFLALIDHDQAIFMHDVFIQYALVSIREVLGVEFKVEELTISRPIYKRPYFLPMNRGILKSKSIRMNAFIARLTAGGIYDFWFDSQWWNLERLMHAPDADPPLENQQLKLREMRSIGIMCPVFYAFALIFMILENWSVIYLKFMKLNLKARSTHQKESRSKQPKSMASNKHHKSSWAISSPNRLSQTGWRKMSGASKRLMAPGRGARRRGESDLPVKCIRGQWMRGEAKFTGLIYRKVKIKY